MKPASFLPPWKVFTEHISIMHAGVSLTPQLETVLRPFAYTAQE